MALTKKRARELARKRWDKHRATGAGTATIELEVDPATVPPPKSLKQGEPAAPPTVVSIDTFMGGRKPWPLHQDLVKMLDNGGYLLLRRSPINYQPKLKAASAINSLDLVAVSTDNPGSERQKAFQKILDQMPGREQLIDWLMMHGFDEGLTFYQILQAPARDTGDEYIYPSFLAGGFHKENAADNQGEGLRWNGATEGYSIAKPRTYNPWMTQKENAAGSFPFDDFIVFSPGGGPNTEGNLKMARVLLPLCSQYEAASLNRDDFIEIFGLPIKAWQSKVEGARPDAIAGLVREAAQKAGIIGTEEGKAIGMRMGMDEIALLEPKGTSSAIILETMKDLRTQVHQIWLGNELTTSTQESGPAGSSTVQSGEQNKHIMRYARLIAQGICPPLLKWVGNRNPDFPELEEDEGEVYLQFQPEGRRTLVGLPERSPQMAPMMTGNVDPTGQQQPGMQGMPQPGMQRQAYEVRGKDNDSELSKRTNGEIVRHLLLAKPAGMVVPPVHPNCVLPGQEVWCPDVCGATHALYEGICVEITLASGHRLSVTPNHPVLTPSGFVPAEFLDEGDEIMFCANPERVARGIDPDNEHRPALIEEVFDALRVASGVAPCSVELPPEDFHGDASGFVGQVDVVDTRRLLRRKDNAALRHSLGEHALGGSGEFEPSTFARGSAQHLLRVRHDPSPGCPMCGGDLPPSQARRHTRPLGGLRGGLVARGDAVLDQPLVKDEPTDAALARQFVRRFAGDVAPHKISNVRRFWDRTHVYDLQASDYGVYICNGVVVHNCRCEIVETERGTEWVDARDSRVCPECRAYGAVFNALERGDVKLTDDEAEAITDARESPKFKKALEYDPDTQQQAVTEAAGTDKQGILQQSTKARGIEPSPEELMDRVEEALDKSRQAAEVQRGITIGTGPSQVTLPEAVIAPRVTVTSAEGVASVVRPQFVGAVVSSGGRYSVVWTMRQDGFRAVLFDKVRDRQITSNRNLWWLLLLFAELERREQARKQEREAAQSNT